MRVTCCSTWGTGIRLIPPRPISALAFARSLALTPHPLNLPPPPRRLPPHSFRTSRKLPRLLRIGVKVRLHTPLLVRVLQNHAEEHAFRAQLRHARASRGKRGKRVAPADGADGGRRMTDRRGTFAAVLPGGGASTKAERMSRAMGKQGRVSSSECASSRHASSRNARASSERGSVRDLDSGDSSPSTKPGGDGSPMTLRTQRMVVLKGILSSTARVGREVYLVYSGMQVKPPFLLNHHPGPTALTMTALSIAPLPTSPAMPPPSLLRHGLRHLCW